MGVKCFYLEKTERVQRKLRRYSSKVRGCSAYDYHNADVFLDVIDGPHASSEDWPGDDPRWPVKCDHCEYVFVEEDARQLFVSTLYRRVDTGEEMTLRDAPPGAMWNADWLLKVKGYGHVDGRCLEVKCPNGRNWVIDSRASNCTNPDDSSHKCWVRHGEPPYITVDKNGETCRAGGGSILVGGYHGFLRNGEFSP